MGRVLRALSLTGAVLMLGACGIAAGPSDTATASSEGLDGVVWVLDELDGAPPASDTPVTVEFNGFGSLGGTGGCNNYSGSYELSGTTIDVGSDLASTMMACPGPVMDVEQAFFTALHEAKGVAVEGDRLTLSDADGNTLATFTAQSQDLAGTSWRITAYNNGKGGVVTVIDGTEAAVSFVQDGTVTGTGGCNSFSGAYTTGDGIVTISSLSATKKQCDEPDGVMGQDKRIRSVLRDASTYLVVGDRLELRLADGSIGMDATAASEG